MFHCLRISSEKHPKNGFWLHWMGSYGSRVPSEAFSFRVLVWGFRAPYLKNATKKFYTIAMSAMCCTLPKLGKKFRVLCVF